MIIKHKSIEKKSLPQIQKLTEGEAFQLIGDRSRIFILTSFEGDDLDALFQYRYGSDDDTVYKLIDKELENKGKERCMGSYYAAVNIATGKIALFHGSVEVIPVNCELYFQEKENYNI